MHDQTLSVVSYDTQQILQLASQNWENENIHLAYNVMEIWR